MRKYIHVLFFSFFLLGSSFASAGGYLWTEGTKVLKGEVQETRKEAYNSGFDMIKKYQSMNKDTLRKSFISPYEYSDHKSFSITGVKVNVEEYLSDKGTLMYQPLLEVKYKYRRREPGSNR